jgi:hypothetical protein
VAFVPVVMATICATVLVPATSLVGSSPEPEGAAEGADGAALGEFQALFAGASAVFCGGPAAGDSGAVAAVAEAGGGAVPAVDP